MMATMKRVKGEQINSTLLQYLKRRQFTDTETTFKRDLKLVQSVEEMSMSSTVNNETGVSNVFLYSSHICQPNSFFDQYQKLFEFITEDVRFRQLRKLLFPVFVHFYLDLVQNGYNNADSFYAKHHQYFFSEGDPMVSSFLSGLVHKKEEDIFSKSQIKSFRENKFRLELADDLFQMILRFMNSDDNKLLLKVISTRITIDCTTATGGTLSSSQADRGPPEKDTGGTIILSEKKSETCSTTNTDENSQQKSTNSNLQILKDIVSKISDDVLDTTAVCFYGVNNAKQSLNSVAVGKRYLCAGFDDSSIRIWNLISEEGLETDLKPCPLRCYQARGHSGSVNKVCLVDNDEYILSCSEDSTVRLWNVVQSLENVVLYKGHGWPVWDLDVSHSESYFVTGSKDTTAKLWSFERTYPLRMFVGHTMDVDSVLFHPNSSYVATGSTDKTIRLWTVQDGKCVRLLNGHRGAVFSLSFAPNGNYLASAGEDRRVKIWDLRTGTILKDLRGHTDMVYCLSFSPDSAYIASGGLDCKIHVWDSSTNSEEQKETYSNPSPELKSQFHVSSMTNVQFLKYTSPYFIIAAGSRGLNN